MGLADDRGLRGKAERDDKDPATKRDGAEGGVRRKGPGQVIKFQRARLRHADTSTSRTTKKQKKKKKKKKKEKKKKKMIVQFSAVRGGRTDLDGQLRLQEERLSSILKAVRDGPENTPAPPGVGIAAPPAFFSQPPTHSTSGTQTGLSRPPQPHQPLGRVLALGGLSPPASRADGPSSIHDSRSSFDGAGGGSLGSSVDAPMGGFSGVSSLIARGGRRASDASLTSSSSSDEDMDFG